MSDDADTPAPPTLSRETAHAFLRSRRSVRRYRPGRPPDAVLHRIFCSVAMAPSAHNRQPWRFFVIRDRALAARLATAMGERLAADRRRDGDPEEAIAQDVARAFARITGAPVVILVALTMAEMDTYPDAARSAAEHLMAVQSTAMATQNLLLAAHAEGLGTCWMCAPMFCPDAVRSVVPVPSDWELQGLVTLGRPAAPGRDKPRKALPEFVRLGPVATGADDPDADSAWTDSTAADTEPRA